MARGISLHVGINRASVAAFQSHPLLGPENDAREMCNIAVSRNFEDVTLLRGAEATFERVVGEISRAAAGPNRLTAGDIFLFTFAGHGSRIPDQGGEESLTGEPDGKDESLVLFDRLLLDDHLRRVLWPMFEPGVRIVGVADCCHSGSVLHAIPGDPAADVVVQPTGGGAAGPTGGVVVASSLAGLGPHGGTPRRGVPAAGERFSAGVGDEAAAADEWAGEEGFVSVFPADRGLDDHERRAHTERAEFRAFYRDLGIPSEQDAPPVRADLLLMAACRDKAKTKDGSPNGAFTRVLLDVWRNGGSSSDYVTFMENIGTRIRVEFPDQFPTTKPDVLPAFSSTPPFSI